MNVVATPLMRSRPAGPVTSPLTSPVVPHAQHDQTLSMTSGPDGRRLATLHESASGPLVVLSVWSVGGGARGGPV